MGRAGRPQYDRQGVAVIMVHDPKKSFYKKFLYEPFPVESSLLDQVCQMHQQHPKLTAAEVACSLAMYDGHHSLCGHLYLVDNLAEVFQSVRPQCTLRAFGGMCCRVIVLALSHASVSKMARADLCLLPVPGV